jgi:hypothetical protein
MLETELPQRDRILGYDLTVGQIYADVPYQWSNAATYLKCVEVGPGFVNFTAVGEDNRPYKNIIDFQATKVLSFPDCATFYLLTEKDKELLDLS